ncbi:MAG: hypothetical protein K1X63_01950 [Chitinophagales bacterium]|nr:hypothetical protein [Bacteroidota bacterium]MBX7139815.1 hypothetical protein [Chitinophagales bacterium]
MSRILLSCLTVLLLSAWCANAQTTTASSYKQMVVGLNNFDEANIDQVTSRFNGIDGIHLSAYCSELNCLILEFDPSKFSGPEKVMQTLRSMKITGFLKINTTLDPLTTGCTVMSQNTAHSEH